MRILVSAYLDRNFGDDMMVSMLANTLWEHTIYLDAYNTENNSVLTFPFEGIANICAYNLSQNSKMRLKQIREFDAYIRIGGSIFKIDGDLSHLRGIWNTFKYYQRVNIMRKLKKYNIPYLILGCNTGPFKKRLGEKLALKEFSAASLVTVRDSSSYRFVSQATGLKSLFQYPDMVLSAPLPACQSDIGHLRQYNCLGISAYRSTNRSINYELYKKLADIGDEYIRRTGGRVNLYVFDIENENDSSAAFTIKQMAKESESFNIVPYVSSPNQFVEKVNNCDSMISVRFHSLVLALRLGIPVLPIIYSSKTSQFLDDLSYSGARLDVSAMGNVDPEAFVDAIISKRNLLRIDDGTRLMDEAGGHMRAVREFFDRLLEVPSRLYYEEMKILN